eukprot:CAMPEP_0172756548 /NCGR_PEP_ID=MMETSP1074-20121228/161959_1 /TAXON_ID=2916 /ORGANISM="Ceratium fusus, Strain PA161109" /LENGTH=158 /DNA_ID=CAMNT_0013589817 /DNA_START=411 /DNA_END=887 /DNA_ORIENTATION=-
MMVQCCSKACECNWTFRIRTSSLVEASGSTPPKVASLPSRRMFRPQKERDAFLQQRFPTVILRVHTRRANISGNAKLVPLVKAGLTHVMSTFQGPRISQCVSTNWTDSPVGVYLHTCFDVKSPTQFVTRFIHRDASTCLWAKNVVPPGLKIVRARSWK